MFHVQRERLGWFNFSVSYRRRWRHAMTRWSGHGQLGAVHTTTTITTMPSDRRAWMTLTLSHVDWRAVSVHASCQRILEILVPAAIYSTHSICFRSHNFIWARPWSYNAAPYAFKSCAAAVVTIACHVTEISSIWVKSHRLDRFDHDLERAVDLKEHIAREGGTGCSSCAVERGGGTSAE